MNGITRAEVLQAAVAQLPQRDAELAALELEITALRQAKAARCAS